MAILEDIPGVEVAITVGGADLKEYEQPGAEVEEKITTKYIESASGAKFSVRMKLPKGFNLEGDMVLFDVSLDGKKYGGSLLGKDNGPLKREIISAFEGVRTDDSVQRFQFSELRQEDKQGAPCPSDVARVKDLGSIKVELYHQRQIERTKQKAVASGPVRDVPEKALKGRALSHTAVLGKSEKSGSVQYWKTARVPGHEEPIATFVFHYRSLEALKQEYIIPRTPTPVPLAERDPLTLTQDEMIQIIRENQAKEAKRTAENEARVKVKREKRDEDERARKRARVSQSTADLEIDEDGSVREGLKSTAQAEVIELD